MGHNTGTMDLIFKGVLCVKNLPLTAFSRLQLPGSFCFAQACLHSLLPEAGQLVVREQDSKRLIRSLFFGCGGN
jgi:hypothetical protein